MEKIYRQEARVLIATPSRLEPPMDENDCWQIHEVEMILNTELRFSRGGGVNPPGGANIRFCQIVPKTARNCKNLDPG